MPNIDLVRSITNSNLPLELVDGQLLQQLKVRKHTSVGARELKSAPDLLISEGFARCQGISFLNGNDVGALAHNYSTHDPYYTLTGDWTGGQYNLEDPRVIFKELSKVLAIHVYHEERYEWPERWIEGALGRIGIVNVVHIPIRSKEPGKVFWRDIVQDVKDGSVYVFPRDFSCGIKYQTR